MPPKTCHCGCGQQVNGTYARGHNRKGERPWNRKSDVPFLEEDRGFETPCWIWQRKVNTRGYGELRVQGRDVRAARHYYERHVGPIPDGLTIDHLCFQPSCVNPAHLEPVTQAVNGRRRRTTKLTEDAVRIIRDSSDRGIDLARRFGVSPGTICDVQSGRSWSS